MGREGFTLTGKRVAVIGQRGMVGSALIRRLKNEPCELFGLGRNECDLRRQDATERWFAEHRPDLVFLAAAKVGGISANSAAPGQFLYDNLIIEANVIEAARKSAVEKLVFLGSSCIYPKFAAQPIVEEALLSGPLEPTNEWYAIAKIAGIKLCQAYRRQYGCDFVSVQPTNLYGPGDNYDLETSHVVPAILRKAHEARLMNSNVVTIWGSGAPKREFLHVDDLADALVFITSRYSDEAPINIGSGEEVTVEELAGLAADVVGFAGRLSFDISRPDGAPRKLLDSRRLRDLGWSPSISLADGLSRTYQDFLRSHWAKVRLSGAAA